MKVNPKNIYDKDYFIGGTKSNYLNYLNQEKTFEKYWMKYVTRYSKLAPIKTHLDVGCAYGVLVKKMLELGWKSCGIDISEYAIAEGKKVYGNIDLKKCSADVLPYSDNDFGYITCIDVVEHLDNDEIQKALTEIYRCLKPGGIVFIATPNVFDNSLVDIFSEDYVEKDITHINYQSSYDLYRLFYNNKFSKIIIRGSSPFIPQITELNMKNETIKKILKLFFQVLMHRFIDNDKAYSSYLFVVAIK